MEHFDPMKLLQKKYSGEVENPREVINLVAAARKTGSLTLHFNMGGLCRQVDWLEKVPENERVDLEPMKV